MPGCGDPRCLVCYPPTEKEMTHKNTWKQFERTVAKGVGAERTALSGSNSKGTSSDTSHPSLYIECKLRANPNTWNLWEDTRTKADKENKIPVLALKKKGKKGFLYVVHVEDVVDFCSVLMEQPSCPKTSRPV